MRGIFNDLFCNYTLKAIVLMHRPMARYVHCNRDIWRYIIREREIRVKYLQACKILQEKSFNNSICYTGSIRILYEMGRISRNTVRKDISIPSFKMPYFRAFSIASKRASGTESIRYEEEYVLNSRGMKLFTCRWLPANSEPKAMIFLCHGYAMDSSISMNGAGTRLAKAGFGVYGIDYEGHGKSAGLAGYIPNFDHLVTDCSNHFTSICEKKENKKKLRILMGESMGGAMVLLLHRKKPNYWDGGVMVAPMCKIADDIRPHPLVISVLAKLTKIIPTWKIVPTQDIIDVAFRVPQVREEIRANPLCYKGRPRLQTGHQLLQVSMDLEERLEEVSLPFIIVHGGDDKVTDPSVSKLLYESASSSDKTFKLYPGMWHSLTYGELPENIDIVFKDIINWLNEKSTLGNSRLEREQKFGNDDLLSVDPATK